MPWCVALLALRQPLVTPKLNAVAVCVTTQTRKKKNSAWRQAWIAATKAGMRPLCALLAAVAVVAASFVPCSAKHTGYAAGDRVDVQKRTQHGTVSSSGAVLAAARAACVCQQRHRLTGALTPVWLRWVVGHAMVRCCFARAARVWARCHIGATAAAGHSQLPRRHKTVRGRCWAGSAA